MTTNQDLMQRLAVSKKIMEKTENLQRNNNNRRTDIMVEDYQPVNATYNLPNEFIPQQEYNITKHDPTVPLDENRILNSKLPDEIKRLMLEQPIVQPSSMGGGTVLSDEIIEGASRLMKKDKLSEPQPQSPKQKITETNTTSNFNINEIKNIIRDVVRDTVRDVVREELKEAGMLVESTENSNEVIQFKVGQHLFVGRVTKIKKLEK